MRRQLTLAVQALAILGASALPAFARDQQAEADILQIETNMAAAKSADGVLKYFDPSIVLDDIMPPEVRGFAAVIADLDQQYAAEKDLKTDILRIAVEADGEIGFAYSVQHSVMTPK